MPLYSTIVRYGKMRHLTRTASELKDLDIGDFCILKTDRGMEWGTVTSIPLPVSDLRKMSDYTIVREVTENDYAHRDRIPNIEMEFMHKADNLVADLKLPMTMVTCEILFGGERIVAYFQSEDRVDFRGLVRKLGTEFSSKIEMRQLGDREIARLLGDIDTCGLTLCCQTHLKKFKPISMKMARIQLSSLNSDKLSGQCGRLKCCLRYEYDQYMELVADLPKKKKKVTLPDSRVVTVLDQNILAQSLLVDIDGERQTVTANDYLEMCQQAPKTRSCDSKTSEDGKKSCQTPECGGGK